MDIDKEKYEIKINLNTNGIFFEDVGVCVVLNGIKVNNVVFSCLFR